MLHFSNTCPDANHFARAVQVTYEDGDIEEVDWAELSKLVAAAETKSPAKRKAAPAKAAPAKKAKAVEGEHSRWRPDSRSYGFYRSCNTSLWVGWLLWTLMIQ